MDEYTLKPCPFCGKSVAEFATLKEMEDCKHFEDDICPVHEMEECSGIRIVCNVLKGGCGASTGYAFNKDNAVAMWNRRRKTLVIKGRRSESGKPEIQSVTPTPWSMSAAVSTTTTIWM